MLGGKARRIGRVQNHGNADCVQGSRAGEVGSDGGAEASVSLLQDYLQTQGCVPLLAWMSGNC